MRAQVAVALEKHALSDDYFIKRKLYPNVDFYSGLIYRCAHLASCRPRLLRMLYCFFCGQPSLLFSLHKSEAFLFRKGLQLRREMSGKLFFLVSKCWPSISGNTGLQWFAPIDVCLQTPKQRKVPMNVLDDLLRFFYSCE